MISRKINFSAKVPSKDTLKLAISEEIVHFCEKTLQKGVDKYTFKRFIGRGIKFFHNFSKSCPLLSLPILVLSVGQFVLLRCAFCDFKCDISELNYDF